MFLVNISIVQAAADTPFGGPTCPHAPPMMRGAPGLGQWQRAQLRQTHCVNTRDRHDGIKDNYIQWRLMHFVTSSRLVVVPETNSAQHAIAVTHSKPV
jgi:hypothetical protein